ncbi:MAG: hypothetical protein PCFJNLEI_00328 [Verrucomicrobiae bacterium]|nr:hypothetical protein [Verrucomicrobiae bacterium]
MYTDTQQWKQIRNLYYRRRLSKRQIIRESGFHWETIKRMLKYPLPVKKKKPVNIFCKKHVARPSRNKLRNAVQVIRDSISPDCIPTAKRSALCKLATYLTDKGFAVRQTPNDYEPHLWMHRVMQKMETLGAVAAMVGDIPDLPALLEKANNGTLMERRKAITVLARHRGISFRSIGRFLCKAAPSVTRYWMQYEAGGMSGSFHGYKNRARLADNEELKAAVVSLLHSPPSQYKINRTSWKYTDLLKCLEQNGFSTSKEVVREILKSAGYKWRKAKTVLTSNDPEYREKLERIKSILSTLGANDRFCSIDEFGHFAVKAKGGKRLVAPDEYPHVPQFQKSKGWLILDGSVRTLAKPSHPFLLQSQEHRRDDHAP